MKNSARLLFLLLCIAPLGRLAAQSEPASDDAAAAFRAEIDLVKAAHAAAAGNNEAGAETLLLTAPAASLKLAPSVALARRAAEVCAWLTNENDHGRAMRLARRVLERLSSMAESTDAERVERLYWEAWLEGQVLDRKQQAIDLLRAAEKLAPEDERVIQLHLRYVAAIAEFGR